MNHEQLLSELALQGKMLSIMPATNDHGHSGPKSSGFCLLTALDEAMQGHTIAITADTKGCVGARSGFGFDDGLPSTKGGFGYFLTCGRGEGFPPGERVKASIEVAEAMIAGQPKDVLDGQKNILIKPYEEADSNGVVTWLATPDQLSALIHLFCYRRPDYDAVIAPLSAGCASVFRIPLGEAKRANPRGVIGNVDIFSRPHFPENTFFFSVPHAAYMDMLEDADTCFFHSPIWHSVHKRIHGH